MSHPKGISIKSLAAPTEAEATALRALAPERRRELLAAELAKGERDIAAGRYTDLNTDEDIRKLFEEIRAADEAPAV